MRIEVEHLSLMDDEKKINLPSSASEVPSEPQMYPAKVEETKETDDSVDVRARIANSYNRYSRLDQQGALNQPNNARKEEVEHRLESQQRAVRRLAELNSPEYQRLAQRYNRYARLDDVTARLDELVAAEEDKHEEVKTMPTKDIPMDEIAERGTDGRVQQQKVSELQQQKQLPQEGSIRAPPRRAGPGLATTESFREQRQICWMEAGRSLRLPGGCLHANSLATKKGDSTVLVCPLSTTVSFFSSIWKTSPK